MNPNAAEKRELCEDLADEIRGIILDGHWELDLEELLERTEISREDYYRWGYARAGRIAGSVRDSFDEDSVGEMVAFLIDSGFPDVVSVFRNNGLYFSAGDLGDWLLFFRSSSKTRLQNHRINEETLETILSGCFHARDGFEFYREHLIPFDELIEKAIPDFLEELQAEDHSISRKILEGVIRHAVRSRSLDPEALYRDFFHRLASLALNRGWIEAEEELLEEDAELDDRKRSALKLLGFSGRTLPDPEKLKKAYRKKIKEFHPDTNPEPEAQEKTRRVIEAFALLSD